MVLIYYILQGALLSVGPVLIAVAGIAALCVFVPRGERMPYVTLIAVAAAAFVLMRDEIRRVAPGSNEKVIEAAVIGLCPHVGTRRYAELPAGQKEFHLSDRSQADAARLQTLFLGQSAGIAIRTLGPAESPPQSGYMVFRRRLPAPVNVDYGIFAVREAVTGRLVAERVYVNATSQPDARPNARGAANRVKRFECGPGGVIEQSDAGAQFVLDAGTGQLASFLGELAKVKTITETTIEVKLDAPYRAIDNCAPLIRLSLETKESAVTLRYLRDGDALVIAVLAPEALVDFSAWLAEKRKRSETRILTPWPSYKSKYVDRDLLRCHGYFGADGVHAAPILHPNGYLEPPERVTAVVAKTRIR